MACDRHVRAGLFYRAPDQTLWHPADRWVRVVLQLLCIAIALSGVELHQFVLALFLLGVNRNFLFTGSTTLSMETYRPEEKDQAQAAINFAVFAVMAFQLHWPRAPWSSPRAGPC